MRSPKTTEEATAAHTHALTHAHAHKHQPPARKVAAGNMLCAALIASSVAELAALSGLSL